MADTLFRFYTHSADVKFRFVTDDYPPYKMRFITGSEDTRFRFVIDDLPPTKFRFYTSSLPTKFRFLAGEPTLMATLNYQVATDCHSAALSLQLENTYSGETFSVTANKWDDATPIHTQQAGNNWIVDLGGDGAYRVEFTSNMRGHVLTEYIFVHCAASKRYNAYLLSNCGHNEKLTDLKYQQLKAIRRSAFSLHKTGHFKESKAMLDQIIKLTCDDRLY